MSDIERLLELRQLLHKNRLTLVELDGADCGAFLAQMALAKKLTLGAAFRGILEGWDLVHVVKELY